MSGATSQDHKSMMAHPWRWPCRPLLPLVRRRPDGGLDLGVLVEGLTSQEPRLGTTVFCTNLLCFPMSEEQWQSLPKEAFDSLDDVLAAGWRVD